MLMQAGAHRRLAVAAAAIGATGLCLFAIDVLVHGRGIGRGQELSCAYTSRCLPSYGNTSVCESLATGISERELIFRLGRPTGESGNALYFESGAGERGPIKVDLDAQRRAARFVCHPSE